jgi:Tat protein secretion system quality control protein TatD with DNase activity
VIEAASADTKQALLADYITKIDELISSSDRKDKFVAIGECGLDYDRFEYANKEE